MGLFDGLVKKAIDKRKNAPSPKEYMEEERKKTKRFARTRKETKYKM